MLNQVLRMDNILFFLSLEVEQEKMDELVRSSLAFNHASRNLSDAASYACLITWSDFSSESLYARHHSSLVRTIRTYFCPCIYYLAYMYPLLLY